MIPKLRNKYWTKGEKKFDRFLFFYSNSVDLFFCYQFIFYSLQLLWKFSKLKFLYYVSIFFPNIWLLCLEFILIFCRHLCRFQTSFWFGLFSVHPVNSWKRRIFHFITLEYPVMSRDNDEWTSGTRNHRCYHGEIGRIKSGKIKRQKKQCFFSLAQIYPPLAFPPERELRVATNRNCSGLMTL